MACRFRGWGLGLDRLADKQIRKPHVLLHCIVYHFPAWHSKLYVLLVIARATTAPRAGRRQPGPVHLGLTTSWPVHRSFSDLRAKICTRAAAWPPYRDKLGTWLISMQACKSAYYANLHTMQMHSMHMHAWVWDMSCWSPRRRRCQTASLVYFIYYNRCEIS